MFGNFASPSWVKQQITEAGRLFVNLQVFLKPLFPVINQLLFIPDCFWRQVEPNMEILCLVLQQGKSEVMIGMKS